jgi:hypothetical protein
MTVDAKRKEWSWSPAAWGIAAMLWVLPLVAMQFTHEVNWSAFDFAVWAVMLASAAGASEVAKRLTARTAYRAIAGVAITAAFLLVWASLID